MKEKADFSSVMSFPTFILTRTAPLLYTRLSMGVLARDRVLMHILGSLPAQKNVSQEGPDKAIIYILQTTGA